MAKRWFVTICHDFELHMAMINSHAHLRNKGCLRFSSISDRIWWISDRFRQMSPKSSVNVDVAVFWLHGYFWSICRHRFSGCGRRNTFATFSEDVLQFSWQAQHLGRVHRHFEGQAKHFRRVVLRVFCESQWQGCVKWRQGADSVAGVAFCEMWWKLTEASHETSILRWQI